jgi:hypothetical protein
LKVVTFIVAVNILERQLEVILLLHTIFSMKRD